MTFFPQKRGVKKKEKKNTQHMFKMPEYSFKTKHEEMSRCSDPVIKQNTTSQGITGP